MRWLLVLGVAAVAIAGGFSVWSLGRSGESTAPLPAPQDDYLEAAADALSVLDRDDSASKYPLYATDLGPIDEAKEALARWDSLGPPSDLAPEHRNLTKHLHQMVDDYEDGAENVGGLLTFDEPFNKWKDAVAQRFPQFLFHQRGGFMEPTFCSEDMVLFEPSDGKFERWDIVLLASPLRDEGPPQRIEGYEMLRVAGLPGESITVGPAGVVINGRAAEGDIWASRQADFTFGPVSVPPGQYFLVADKRWKAIDSRNSIDIGEPTFYKPSEIIGKLPPDARACKYNHPTGE
jgi:signal peptidase I